MTSYRYEIKEKDKNLFPFDEKSFEVNALALKKSHWMCLFALCFFYFYMMFSRFIHVIACTSIQLIQYVLSCFFMCNSLQLFADGFFTIEPPGKPL